MCKCGAYTLKEFQDECRKLWCSVATAYATDGHHQDRMSSWGNSAVAQFTTQYGHTVSECKCKKGDNDEKTNN